mgnify:CR=1 FL=1
MVYQSILYGLVVFINGCDLKYVINLEIVNEIDLTIIQTPEEMNPSTHKTKENM